MNTSNVIFFMHSVKSKIFLRAIKFQSSMLSWQLFACGPINDSKVIPAKFNTFTMEGISMEVPAALMQVTTQTGNQRCFDCGAQDTEWASLGFGNLVCLTCAGFHRSLGTHITSVRAIKLDSWTADQVAILERGGNKAFQVYCEAIGIKKGDVLSMSKYGNPRVLYYR